MTEINTKVSATKLSAKLKRLQSKYIKLNREMIKTQEEAVKVFQQLEMKNRKGHKVIVKEETIGKGKNKKTAQVGRHYWKEKFTDESTGEFIFIERSRIVSIDGEYHES